MGQIKSPIHLVENKQDVAKLSIPNDQAIACVTQTTLSLDDTKSIIHAIKKKYSHVVEPKKMIFVMQQPIGKKLLKKLRQIVIYLFCI